MAGVIVGLPHFGHTKERQTPCPLWAIIQGGSMKTKHLLVVAFFLIALLTACGSSGSSSLPAVSPDLLQISEHVGSEKATQYTVTNPEKIQQLYTALGALPGRDALQGCPTIGGPSYDLTFSKNGKVVLKVQASRDGCGTVVLPQDDQRQPDDHFWSLLTQAIQS